LANHIKLFINNNNIKTSIDEAPDVGTGYINVILGRNSYEQGIRAIY
jgi:hypothetical protein